MWTIARSTGVRVLFCNYECATQWATATQARPPTDVPEHEVGVPDLIACAHCAWCGSVAIPLEVGTCAVHPDGCPHLAPDLTLRFGMAAKVLANSGLPFWWFDLKVVTIHALRDEPRHTAAQLVDRTRARGRVRLEEDARRRA